jgi:hypothetical protein
MGDGVGFAVILTIVVAAMLIAVHHMGLMSSRPARRVRARGRAEAHRRNHKR